MATLLETFTLDMLTPAQNPQDARQDAVQLGASLTILAGTALAIKTADNKGYPMVAGASDGTQNFKGFCMYNVATDSSGKVYYVSSPGTGVVSYRTAPWSTVPMWITGIFDPQDLRTAVTPAAEVDTMSATGTVTTGDVHTLTITYPDLTTTVVTATVGATATATAIDNLLRTQWNATPAAVAYATASGTSTLILTSAIPGNIMNIGYTVTGTGTAGKVVTTAATGRVFADFLVGNPGARVLHNGFWKF